MSALVTTMVVISRAVRGPARMRPIANSAVKPAQRNPAAAATRAQRRGAGTTRREATAARAVVAAAVVTR